MAGASYRLPGPVPVVVCREEYQRLGGVCSMAPFSCFLCDVLGRALELVAGRGVEGSVVVDATYGVGGFWRGCRPRRLVAVDLRRRRWLVEPDHFIQGDALSRGVLEEARRAAGGRVDLLVVDPPYNVRPMARSGRVCADNAGRGVAWRKLMAGVPVMAARLAARLVAVKGMLGHNRAGSLYAADPETLPGYWLQRWGRLLTPLRLFWYTYPRRGGGTVSNNASWLLLLKR